MTNRSDSPYTIRFRCADDTGQHDQDIIDKLAELARTRDAARYIREALRAKMEAE